MNDFVRCNKLTGVHWLQESVKGLKIKIRLKPPDDIIISLPKFEEYRNETVNLNLEPSVEEFSFKWQEKCFSASEIQRYTDVHNCLTENELKYHDLIKTEDVEASKVFTYIHEDYIMPLPQEKKKRVGLISSYLECLSLDDVVGKIGDAFGGKSMSERCLFKSQEDVGEEDAQWTAMHVVLDNSEYNEDTLVIKQEATLLSLYHNISKNCIIISPDLNNLETNPYVVETDGGELLGQQYEVQVEFGRQAGGEELVTLLTKLCNKWEKKHKNLVNFVMPPLGKRQYCVSVELVSAGGFHMDELYIEYDVKLPEGVECSDTLHGRTHVAEAACKDGDRVWNFGHIVELCLEVDTGMDIPLINIYFEAISTDFWHRHRTEGYTHLSIHLTPGISSQELRCVRPDEKTGAEDRRFFVGGCHLFKDLQVLSRPELQNGDYTYTESGTIQIRHSIISQSSLPTNTPGSGGHEVHYDTSSASALLLGAEAALRKYKKARAKLAHATTRPD